MDGVKEGLWVTYYANGNKRSEGHYKKGKKDGFWTLYHPNGVKSSEANFVEGKYTGPYTSYHDNGERRWQGRYNDIQGNSADGTKEGVWHDYADDGETIVRRMTYHRGSKTRPDEYGPFAATPNKESKS